MARNASAGARSRQLNNESNYRNRRGARHVVFRGVVSGCITRREWMTENFVLFLATLDFTQPATDTIFLVLKKDNPSGLPEHDAQIEIAVRFR